MNCEVSENPFAITVRTEREREREGGEGGGGPDVDCRRIFKILGVARLKRVSQKEISYMF